MKVHGDRIRRFRESLGMSQADLLDAMEGKVRITQKTLSRIERDKGADPWPSTVETIAKALGVSVDDIRAETEPEVPLERWKQTIYDGEPEKDGKVAKVDEVLLRRRGNLAVSATVHRVEPDSGQEYKFEGRHAEGMIFGYYYRTKGEGSSGVMLLRETGPHATFFRGHYTKIERDILSSSTDTLEIKHVVVDWTYEGSVDSTPTDTATE